ncbi:MAG: lipoyl(octanoyl) transferase LipB [Planctomycetia bacterium]|nr:lipoyl(octanoyl) transferase LipB [Planctomycetia bacterium]
MVGPLPQPDFPLERPLSAYLLGRLEFDTLLALQRRLVYDITGDRDTAAVVMCDHPTSITVGREGSATHIRPNPDELSTRGWPVEWVSRGGGVMLHVPGQVACYPIFALDMLGLTVNRYVSELQELAVDLLREFGVEGTPEPDRPGVRANGRRIAHVGVAVRSWVSCFGLIVNVNPDLAPFREVRCDGDALPMTSLQRESPLRVRVSGVRQRLLELITTRFGFTRVSVFHNHPGALPRPTRHAIPHGS